MNAHESVLGRKYIETGERIPRKASKRSNLLPAKMPKLAAADLSSGLSPLPSLPILIEPDYAGWLQ